MVHHKALSSHLLKINLDPAFDDSTRAQASEFYDVLTNKHFLSSLALLLDIEEVLKAESKIFQVRGSSIIGQERRQKSLLDRLTKIKDEQYDTALGKWTRHLLAQSTCQEMSQELVVLDETGNVVHLEAPRPIGNPRQCTSLIQFEDNQVIFEEKVLDSNYDGEFKKLSDFREAFMAKLIAETIRYLPPIDLVRDLGILDREV